MDARVRKEIEKRARLYGAAKDQAKIRIRSNIKIAIEKLTAIENKLLEEAEIEFGENPFTDFLIGDNHTEDEIKSILSKEIPSSLGPDEESFCYLFKEIDSLNFWKHEKKR